MKRAVLVFLFAILSLPVLCQQPLDELSKEELKNYRKIRTHVKKAPDSVTLNLADLGKYLETGMNTDLEKVRSFYLWIAFNITYDMKMFLRGKWSGQSVPTVLERKMGICDGYSNLFSALCTQAGIESAKILGYSKGYGYNPGQTFAVSNHAWNAVKLGEEWFLLDVTWAASSSNNPDFKSAENNLERYFLTEPEIFLIDHLPEDPDWQLREEPISLEDFEAGKNVPKSKKKSKVANSKDVYGKEITHYTRIVNHNSRNKEARFRLGYAYLSKALDTLETIHDLEGEATFENIAGLGERVMDLLDEAEKHFSMLDRSYSNYSKARTLLTECIYQKGVFNYEAGYQLLSLMVDMDPETYQSNAEVYGEEVNRYWDEAVGYFERVPPGSIYTDQAKRYVDYYIPEFRP